MSQCPNCQKKIDLNDKNIGALFTCPQCQAVYFINFDGNPEYDPNPATYIPETPEAKQNIGQSAKQKDSSIGLDTLKGVEKAQKHQESESNAGSFSQTQSGAVIDAMESGIGDIHQMHSSEEAEDLGDFAVAETPGENFESDLNQFTSESFVAVPSSDLEEVGAPIKARAGTTKLEPNVGVSEKPMSGKSAMREIVEFANSNETNSAGVEYNLKISGIDSKDLIESVKEALTDSRFLWDLEKILSEMRSGELELKKISPVKAAIIVSRLRFVGLNITWEQNVI